MERNSVDENARSNAEISHKKRHTVLTMQSIKHIHCERQKSLSLSHMESLPINAIANTKWHTRTSRTKNADIIEKYGNRNETVKCANGSHGTAVNERKRVSNFDTVKFSNFVRFVRIHRMILSWNNPLQLRKKTSLAFTRQCMLHAEQEHVDKQPTNGIRIRISNSDKNLVFFCSAFSNSSNIVSLFRFFWFAFDWIKMRIFTNVNITHLFHARFMFIFSTSCRVSTLHGT